MTASRLAPAPPVGVSTATFPQEDMLLLMLRESMDRASSELTIRSSTEDPTRINTIFASMMGQPQFRSSLDLWAHSQGLTLQPAARGNNLQIGELDTTTAAADSAGTASDSNTDGTDESVDKEAEDCPPLPNNQLQNMDLDDLFAMAGL